MSTIIKARVCGRGMIKCMPVDTPDGLFNRPVFFLEVEDVANPTHKYQIRHIYPNTVLGHEAATQAQIAYKPGDFVTVTLDPTSIVTLAVATQIIKTPIRLVEPIHG